MFDNYKEGSDLTIMNTIYHYPKKLDNYIIKKTDI